MLMRKLCVFVLALLVFAIPAAALAAGGEVVLHDDFTQGDSQTGLPTAWYAEAWLNGERERLFERAYIEDAPCVHIVNYTDNDARLCREVPVTGGGYYKITCDVMTRDVVGGAGANVSVVGTLAASEPVLGSNGWRRVELIGQVAQAAVDMTVCVRVGGYGALTSGEAWFKNFEVTRLIEPPASTADFSPLEQNGQQEQAPKEIPGGALLLCVLIVAAVGMVCYRAYVLPKPGSIKQSGSPTVQLIMLLTGAFLLRVLLSGAIYGHPTDMACFMAWSNALAENGPAAFYTSGMFADYPPGYLYVLWLVGGIVKLLHIGYGSAGHVLLIKMPGILADLGAAYMVFRLADAHLNRRAALLLCCVVAFNPMMAFVSGGWGQVDQILTLLLVAAVYLFMQGKLELAGFVYGVAILTKPQALMMGPLLAAAYFIAIKDSEAKAKTALRTVAAVLWAIVAALLLSVPFKGSQSGLSWLVSKLLGTATSYPFASVEAFNLFALLGGNWQRVDAVPWLFTYGQWGVAFIALSCALACAFYIKARRDKGSLPLAVAFLSAALFTLGPYMHERYLFPALLFLLIGFLYYRDKRLFLCFIAFTCTMLFNVLMAFMVVGAAELRTAEYARFTRVGSLLTVAAFAYFTCVCWDIMIKKRIAPAFEGRVPVRRAPAPAAAAGETERVTRKDRLCCGILTAVYALVALVNLGGLQAPQTQWKARAGQGAQIRFAQTVRLGEIRVFGGLYTGVLGVESVGGDALSYTQDNGDMFRWKELGGAGWETDAVTLRVEVGEVWFNEIAFFDGAGRQVPIASAAPLDESGPSAAPLADEQDAVPANISYYNGMYFDELYHARTAYEHLHGLDPYENSHPPLGKVLIMLGIAIFGMNPFGWRVIGTLFGVGMVPILYVFAKCLFRRTDYALLAAGLFAFDFMHFTQTRIATVDVFGVFFILLMYYYMYRYYCMDFYTDGLKPTLKPLALSGLFFGLGAASKWIGIYAGGGLAVLFFVSLAQRYIEHRRRKAKGEAGADAFAKNTVCTLLWCCLFFIILPVCIYLASYLPYALSESHYDLERIWSTQKFMFSYHSSLTATHPYSSPWWQWPLDWRPVWYYVGYDVPQGYASTISAFGNPAVWWACSLGAAVVICRLAAGRMRAEKGLFVLLVALAFGYLPWVLITRCTFAYHYFATVPFIILCTVYLLREWEQNRPARAWLKWAWLAAAICLFALFYPVISGLPVPQAYVRALEWLPGWTFLGY